MKVVMIFFLTFSLFSGVVGYRYWKKKLVMWADKKTEYPTRGKRNERDKTKTNCFSVDSAFHGLGIHAACDAGSRNLASTRQEQPSIVPQTCSTTWVSCTWPAPCGTDYKVDWALTLRVCCGYFTHCSYPCFLWLFTFVIVKRWRYEKCGNGGNFGKYLL